MIEFQHREIRPRTGRYGLGTGRFVRTFKVWTVEGGEQTTADDALAHLREHFAFGDPIDESDEYPFKDAVVREYDHIRQVNDQTHYASVIYQVPFNAGFPTINQASTRVRIGEGETTPWPGYRIANAASPSEPGTGLSAIIPSANPKTFTRGKAFLVTEVTTTGVSVGQVHAAISQNLDRLYQNKYLLSGGYASEIEGTALIRIGYEFKTKGEVRGMDAATAKIRDIGDIGIDSLASLEEWGEIVERSGNTLWVSAQPATSLYLSGLILPGNISGPE